jgi:uncharacterized phage-like protein YoqJ
MKTITLSLTGHRPNKLWGYNLTQGKYPILQKTLQNIIITKLKNYHTVICHSGMALGADTVWANAIIKTQKLYPNRIIFVADIPCNHQEKRWPNVSQVQYQNILRYANQKIIYANTYNFHCMQDHNVGMLDACDELIAVWNGDLTGGTANAVKYAQSINLDINRIDPSSL